MRNTSSGLRHVRRFIAAHAYALLAFAALLPAPAANALPSFAQQTGLPCARCHTIAFGPALTPYGRQFKLNGYALGEKKEGSVPLALMAIVGNTDTNKGQPTAPTTHTDTNDNLELNELTGFFAGNIGDHGGAFVEVSYSGTDRSTAWGAFDVRYARSFEVAGHGVVAGATLNNNPTVSDLWNSTPVWGFPYVGSELAPTPGTVPLVVDGVGETILGPTLYAMIDDHWYVEGGGFYGLSNDALKTVGLKSADNTHVDGFTPYWRVAYQLTDGANDFSVGLLGFYARQQPNPGSDATNRYDDFGFDATYQYLATDGSNLAANFSHIHESRHLSASVEAGDAADRSGDLDSTRVDVTYTYEQTWVAAVGAFDISGSRDADLYAPAELDGSAGKPDSRGYLVQLEYVPFGKRDSPYRPWMNLRVGVQYTGYSRFNGSSSNYDGFGRDASDNDTLFAFVWVAI
jgi:hypothetical protein